MNDDTTSTTQLYLHFGMSADLSAPAVREFLRASGVPESDWSLFDRKQGFATLQMREINNLDHVWLKRLADEFGLIDYAVTDDLFNREIVMLFADGMIIRQRLHFLRVSEYWYDIYAAVFAARHLPFDEAQS